MRKGDKIVTREELYKMVWTTPMVRLAKEFGISDVALAKTCRRHNVPRPPRGYWARLAAGQKVKKPPLPKAKGDTEIRLVYHEPIETVPVEKPDIAHLLVEVMPMIEYERRPENRLEVPETLESTNRLIRHTRAVLRSCAPDRYNRVSTAAPGCLDIRVYQSGLDRACCLMHALLGRLRHHRIAIETSNEPCIRSSMVILGERVDFSLEQRGRRIPHVLTPDDETKMKTWSFFRPEKYDYVARDEMVLYLTNVPYRFTDYVTQVYRDTSTLRIEGRLNEFIISAITSAALMKEDQRLKLEEAERREEEHRRELQLQRKQAIQDARRKQLRKQVSDWHQAEAIRQYVAAVRGHWYKKQGSILPDRDIEKWAAWALKQADAMDPILKGHPWTEDVEIDEWRYTYYR